jgi:hypothetical protein
MAKFHNPSRHSGWHPKHVFPKITEHFKKAASKITSNPHVVEAANDIMSSPNDLSIGLGNAGMNLGKKIVKRIIRKPKI